MLSPTTTFGVAVFWIVTSGAGSFVTGVVTDESLLLGLLSSGLATCAVLVTDGMPAASAVVCTWMAGADAPAASTPGKVHVRLCPAVLHVHPFPAFTESSLSPAGTVSVTVRVLSVGSFAVVLVTTRS